ncbi:MAG: ATP-dependent RNA helicase HrpA [Phycisphaerales bacterium]|nr:ATP-dependent RNA helicase HrpA [Phycisphaerales bacterium]
MGEFGSEFDQLLQACPNSVRGLYIARLRGLKKRANTKDSTKIESRIRTDIQGAIGAFELRKNSVPKISYPADLPVSEKREEIRAAIDEHQVVIVCGETGSGKTTQLPKICLELGRGVDGLIGHTQPRRIAARTVASRIADELNVPTGQQVGFKVRFGDATSDKTLVKVMTDGILLAETRTDRKLHRYDTIIIDEAHERSLNIDFLLGYMHQLLPNRRDLKLIITSATIDAERFADHFGTTDGPAPIIEVSGRTYPVETRYEPELVLSGMGIDEAASAAATQLIHEGHPDVLIFMPGEREIRMTAHTLRKQDTLPERVEILPLYARLSPQEQQRVFKPSGAPRIVIATNVAETSLTVPGIRSVVDPGLARLNRYNPRTKIQGLLVEPISQASANQRAGRCGRVAPGVCIRLYEQDDYNGRDEFTQPEILRTNLASVILQMVDLRLGDPAAFPFLDRPDNRQWRDGHETLRELGAIDNEGKLTKHGRTMATLPVDPRIARMIIAGHDEGCLHEVLIIAAALASQDPRVRPHDKRDAADDKHAQFNAEGSDFLAYLKIWDWYHENWKDLTRRKLARACEKNYLSVRRIDEWREIYRQLRSMSIDLGFDPEKPSEDHDAIHRALLTGLLANIGSKGEKHEYKGTHNSEFAVNPGSAVFKAKPQWVMSAEIVRTTKVYARTVARIEPKWIEDAAGDLIKRSYSHPRWDEQSGRVIADERVSLFGLDIVQRRTVHYGPIDPVESRSLFIHHALIEREFHSRSRSLAANQKLRDALDTLEAKARRGDILADTQALFAFYDRRLPPEIYSGRAFDRWAQKIESADPGFLRLKESDLLAASPEEVTEHTHPDAMLHAGLSAPIEYSYQPGESDDGATLRLTIPQLHQLTQDRLDWAVPGFFPARIEALVRSLPKQLRRQFDAPTVARELSPRLESGSGTIELQVAKALSSMTGTTIRPESFRATEIPEHVLPRIEVLDAKGKVIASGRRLRELQSRFREQATQTVKTVATGFERRGITDWDFGPLKETVKLPKQLVAFPGLEVDDKAVALRAFPTKHESETHTRPALGLLYGLSIKRELKLRPRDLPGFTQLAMLGAANGIGDAETAVLSRTGLIACVDNQPIVRTEVEFRARLNSAWNNGLDACQRTISNLCKVFESFNRVRVRLDTGLPREWSRTIAEIEKQLRMLTPAGYLLQTPTNWLWCYPRYLRAIEVRLDRIRSVGITKDQQLASAIAPWVQCLEELSAQDAHTGRVADEFETLRWMVEEYRVATFAQELRTVVPVSDKRLRTQLDKIVHG